MDRRSFLRAAGVGAGAALIGASTLSTDAKSNTTNTQTKTTDIVTEKKTMKIILAADPIALELKDGILAHVKEERA